MAKNAPEAAPESTFFKLDNKTTGWGAHGHCSIPLMEIPLAESFDEPMVLKAPPHRDDKMAITPPPVCQLHAWRANPPKRK